MKRGQRTYLAEVERFCADRGLRWEHVPRGRGDHHKVRLHFPCGQWRCFALSGNIADPRAILNFRTELRHSARQLGTA